MRLLQHSQSDVTAPLTIPNLTVADGKVLLQGLRAAIAMSALTDRNSVEHLSLLMSCADVMGRITDGIESTG